MTNTTQNFPIEEQQSRVKQAFVGLQMLFVAFGALVLVPLITGLDANTALLTAGVGTLLFQLCTGKQVPIFLASSFAFIAPIQYGVATWGIPVTMGGLAFAGLVYVALSALVKNSRRSSIRTYFSTGGRRSGHYHHRYGISPCGRGYGIR